MAWGKKVKEGESLKCQKISNKAEISMSSPASSRYTVLPRHRFVLRHLRLAHLAQIIC